MKACSEGQPTQEQCVSSEILGVDQALELGQSSQAWMEDRGPEFRFRGRSQVLEASFKVENAHFTSETEGQRLLGLINRGFSCPRGFNLIRSRSL